MEGMQREKKLSVKCDLQYSRRCRKVEFEWNQSWEPSRIEIHSGCQGVQRRKRAIYVNDDCIAVKESKCKSRYNDMIDKEGRERKGHDRDQVS